MKIAPSTNNWTVNQIIYNKQMFERRDSMEKVTVDIIQPLGVLSNKAKGWNREVNVVSWNGNPAKIDIRDWSEDHERMSKGIVLTDEEAKALYEALKARYKA